MAGCGGLSVPSRLLGVAKSVYFFFLKTCGGDSLVWLGHFSPAAEVAQRQKLNKTKAISLSPAPIKENRPEWPEEVNSISA